MTDWVDVAVARGQRKLRSMESRASALSVPERTSAPGWLHAGHFYSTVPDVACPWDPAVLRVIRSFAPEAVPLAIRSVWESPNDDGPPKRMVLVRHGLARAIPDPKHPTHSFRCEMPSAPIPGYPRLHHPNFIEVNWYDRDVRPWGYDLPGAYLPFDWFFLRQLRQAFWDGKVKSAESMREEYVYPDRERKEHEAQQEREEQQYRDEELEAYKDKMIPKVSDVEWRDYFMGGSDEPAPKPESVFIGGPQ